MLEHEIREGLSVWAFIRYYTFYWKLFWCKFLC
jgi:hypothetical protein